MQHKHSNHLAQETSPYLLQHAHNPVDWYPWGDEAFAKAKAEGKPILVSIGYSTCHWCHVMERESFEDEQVADYMNKYFVNIKVDREERPDVDSIYMEAVQVIMNGGGGWPLNCFLLPDGKPFFGGTYFPPRPAHGRASWSQVLSNIARAFYERYEEVSSQAAQIMDYVKKSDGQFTSTLDVSTKVEDKFTQATLDTTFESLKDGFDTQDGGFGGAPKFPSTMSLRYCLNYHYYTKNKAALEHVELSLDKMIMGGIYDQVGGGFARYSVDREWLAPHFEKMLYDNALLVGLMADAYLVTKKELYKETIEETLTWVEREMLNAEGGFYSALDADSEGVEGKYYVWQKSEIEQVLGEKATLFCQFYDITEGGNWEHSNIPRRLFTFEDFVAAKNLNLEEFKSEMATCRAKLFDYRETRIRPGLDDKSLLDWNVLMITAYCKAYKALGKEEYKTTALSAIAFVLDKYKTDQASHLYHTYKNGEAKYHAFLDDYAWLINALLEVYSISFDKQWIEKATTYAELVLEEFLDEEDHLFYFTSSKQQDVILRKKDLYDNATPSGNATMLHNLQQLALILDRPSYQEQADKMLLTMQQSIMKYPQSFSRWANAMYATVHAPKELAVVGPNYASLTKEIYQQFIPNSILMAAPKADESLPLLAGRDTGEDTLIFVCSNYTCQLPTATVDKMLEQL
ncbi:MAG: thioredoxin domain-containing protein [Aureispira sp.]|nr:thioredoxin domain-containing protein [Aureispira sp.]